MEKKRKKDSSSPKKHPKRKHLSKLPNETWRGIVTCVKDLGKPPQEAEVNSMIEELTIDHNSHQVGDAEGFTFLEQMSQMVDRIEALEKQSNIPSAFVEDLVLLRAACLDDWSPQKDQQEHTRKLRNDIAHGGNVKSDIETIKRYLFDSERSAKWKHAFKKIYGIPFDRIHEANLPGELVTIVNRRASVRVLNQWQNSGEPNESRAIDIGTIANRHAFITLLNSAIGFTHGCLPFD
ncbi:hypothetical protein V8E54_011690 [Elaphomyces granulatus]